MTSGAPDGPIVFFDGLCGFCDRSVNFLLARDRRHVLRFAPLQGKTAERLLAPAYRTQLDTLVLAVGEKRYLRSGGALRALAATGGVWALVKALLLIPRPLRDAFYDVIARNRYAWFGRRERCRRPAAAERAFFLD